MTEVGIKTTIRKFTVVFRTIDSLQALSVIGKCSIRIRSFQNFLVDKLLLRIRTVKEAVNGHALWTQHNRNMVIVRNLPKYIQKKSPELDA